MNAMRLDDDGNIYVPEHETQTERDRAVKQAIRDLHTVIHWAEALSVPTRIQIASLQKMVKDVHNTIYKSHNRELGHCTLRRHDGLHTLKTDCESWKIEHSRS